MAALSALLQRSSCCFFFFDPKLEYDRRSTNTTILSVCVRNRRCSLPLDGGILGQKSLDTFELSEGFLGRVLRGTIDVTNWSLGGRFDVQTTLFHC